MTALPICGVTNPLYLAISEISSSGLNESKFQAATTYAEGQLEPYATSVSDDISSIIITNFLVLLFIVLVLVIAIVLWMCAMLQIEGYLVAGIILLLLIISAVSFIAFESYASAAVAETLDAATVALTQQITEELIISTLNSAAQEYLHEIGLTCPI